MSLARAAGILVVAAVVVWAVTSFFYLGISFLVMRGHAPARSWWSVLRAMLTEALVIGLTQPLIPLYYVIGRRMGGRRDGRPIILLHGYFQNRADFVYLARALRAAGLGPIYGLNYNWAEGVSECAARLGRFVEEVCRETAKPQVALVAHSLGGVVALEYLASPAGEARVDRCVTIASPHGGVAWRAGMIGRGARQLHAASDYMSASASRRVPIRVLSIFSSHDNIVHPAATSTLAQRGGEDFEVHGIGHLGMLFSREVAEATVRLLSTDAASRP